MRRRRWRTRAALAVAAGVALVATGCTAGSTGTSGANRSQGVAAPSRPAAAADASHVVPAPAHVVVVVFENKSLESVVGADSAPYLNSLAAQGASFVDAHGETHPSEPNYLALFSGSTQGLTDDSCPHQYRADNLAAQLRRAGRTFVGYAEDLPAPGYTGCRTGNYARKHVPWVNFPALPTSVNQPLSSLPSDYAQLPTVSVWVPNMCDDMHNCPVSTGDQWARRHLAGYVAWARDHNSLLIVTFDEDEGTRTNRIPTMVVGPMVAKVRSDQEIDHYALLRAIEDMYRLPPRGGAADAPALHGVWRAGASPSPSG